MDILRIIAIGIATSILAVTVREYKPELAVGVVLAAGAVIFLYAADGLRTAFDGIDEIINIAGTDVRYFGSVMKVTGVAYLTDYAAEICRDTGNSAAAVKLEICGKICIVLFTLPVIKEFLKICIETVKLVW